MPEKPPERMGRLELEAAVRASRAVAVREADETSLAPDRAVMDIRPTAVAVREATVLIPPQSETKAIKTSMRSSWHRGEFWLIVLFQLFITWAGVETTLAILEMARAADPQPSSADIIAAIGGISAVVGAIPFLYLNKRVTERKEAVEDAAPTVVMNRRGNPPANGET